MRETIGAFIDDVKTRHFGQQPTASEEELERTMKVDVQKFVNLQCASGGSINNKSFVVPMIWRFDQKDQPFWSQNRRS